MRYTARVDPKEKRFWAGLLGEYQASSKKSGTLTRGMLDALGGETARDAYDKAYIAESLRVANSKHMQSDTRYYVSEKPSQISKPTRISVELKKFDRVRKSAVFPASIVSEKITSLKLFVSALEDYDKHRNALSAVFVFIWIALVVFYPTYRDFETWLFQFLVATFGFGLLFIIVYLILDLCLRRFYHVELCDSAEEFQELVRKYKKHLSERNTRVSDAETTSTKVHKIALIANDLFRANPYVTGSEIASECERQGVSSQSYAKQCFLKWVDIL